MNAAPSHREVNQRALLIFVIVLALLVSAIGISVSHLQNRYLQGEAQASFQTELTLLGELTVEPMLRNDYDSIQRLVQIWVQRRDYPLRIRVTTSNGFELANEHNNQAITHARTVELPVKFGEKTLLVLHAVADLSVREKNVSTIARNAAMFAVVLVMLLGLAMWSVLKRTAIRPLEAEIAEHTRKEHALQQRTTELETAIRELDSFSYSVSHDLRTPLRAIDGYAHILGQDYAKVLDANAQHYLERTRAAAQRMGQLIDDLLGLARMTQHVLKLADVDLGEMAQKTISRLSEVEPDRQVAIHIAEGLVARADASLIDVALDNLLGNAWKYTAHTPNAIIEFGQQDQNGQAVFFVRDNGAGFDMQFADKLFRPFQRLHGPEFPGSGIGLAMVQRIIQRHGGQIRAEAQPGKGATFYFTLGPGHPGHDSHPFNPAT